MITNKRVATTSSKLWKPNRKAETELSVESLRRFRRGDVTAVSRVQLLHALFPDFFSFQINVAHPCSHFSNKVSLS